MKDMAKGSGATGNRILVQRGIVGDTGNAPGGKRPSRSVTVNLAESPLGWLAARGRISGRQFDAGEQLRRDWTMANLAPRVTMRWDATPAGSRHGGEISPALAQIAAKKRFDAAITAAGSGLSDVLWRVVCAGEGLETAEKAMGWPARAGKVVLGLALDRLADYYGIK